MAESFGGEAVLVVGEERVERVTYKMGAVPVGPYQKELRGELVGPHSARATLLRAHMEGGARLEIAPGVAYSIIPTDMDILRQPPSFKFVAAPA